MTPRTLLAALLLVLPSTLLAQPAVFLVRHAERADAGMMAPAGADPDLSPAGRARAESLAAVLKDARITAIYVTEYRRAGQTADPLAKLLRVEPSVVTSKDIAALVDRLKAASGNVLVIGHSNTLPAVIKALGVEETLAIDDMEYDNLFIVTRGGTPSLLRLHYR
jgi:broad specificity phosphatase PhoE